MAQNWQYATPLGVGLPGSTPVPHNELDAKRMAQRVPWADYPAGYLGTVRSRRENRLRNVNGGRNSLNEKTWHRGVHKATRIEPSDYFWPDEFNPMTGLEYEAQGLKFAPSMNVSKHLVNDGKNTVLGPGEMPIKPDPSRVAHLMTMQPSWR